MVLAALGARTGQTLEASEPVSHDVPAIRVSQVSIGQLLLRIATVTGSEWAKRGSRLVLQGRRMAAERALSARMKNALQQRLKDPAYTTPWDVSVATKVVDETADAMARQGGFLDRNRALEATAGARPAP